MDYSNDYLNTKILKQSISGLFRQGNGGDDRPQISQGNPTRGELFERVQNKPQLRNGQMQINFNITGTAGWATAAIYEYFDAAVKAKQANIHHNQGKNIFVDLKGEAANEFAGDYAVFQKQKSQAR